MAKRSKTSLRIDRKLISLKQPHEVAYWTKRFKTTKRRLQSVIGVVGHSVRKVSQALEAD